MKVTYLSLILGVFWEISSIRTATSLQEEQWRRSFVVDYEAGVFLKDGKEFKYVAGELHYFRVPKVYWRDRLKKARYLGLTAISTYVEWSLHEAAPNNFDFSGEKDLVEFISIAEEEGLLVILRPGPYICAERTWGGLPPWLLVRNPSIKIRSRDPDFLLYVRRWFDKLLPIVKHLLYGNGGPIIMVQVENEFGSYDHMPCDSEYKLWLRDLVKHHVKEAAVLFTTDGSGEDYFKCGPIENILATVDFGPERDLNVTKKFEPARRYNNGGPAVCSEFYPGWITHWGENFSKIEVEVIVSSLRAILRANASLSFYMIHGGTNFGFSAGVNSPPFAPTTTSYDYDAPIDEAGDIGYKYFAIREVLKEFSDSYQLNMKEIGDAPKNSSKAAYGKVKLKSIGSLIQVGINDGEPIISKYPYKFEAMNLTEGFALYETDIPENLADPPIFNLTTSPHDRIIAYIDQAPRFIFSAFDDISITPLWTINGRRLSLLVENQGYINYASRMQGDFKGLLAVPTLGEQALLNWTMTRYSLSKIERLNSLPVLQTLIQPPGFYAADFIIPSSIIEPLDSFLDPTGWGKGVVFINGFNLGRYWPLMGPQVTLYVPGCYLNPFPKVNKLIVFELEKVPDNLEMIFRDSPIKDKVPPVRKCFEESLKNLHSNPSRKLKTFSRKYNLGNTQLG